MVARPPLKVRLELMRLGDVEAVHRIERVSFPVPWPPYAFRQEIETNRLAHYIVARVGGEVVGYAGMWLMVDQAHITTFAVHPAWRRQGIGGRLVLALLRMAETIRARNATLEVRLSNVPARRLYEKFGFRPVGIRPHYYTDNNEDALIMTTDDFDSPGMRERVGRLAAELEAAQTAASDLPGPPGEFGAGGQGE